MLALDIAECCATAPEAAWHAKWGYSVQTGFCYESQPVESVIQRAVISELKRRQPRE